MRVAPIKNKHAASDHFIAIELGSVHKKQVKVEISLEMLK